MSLYLGENLIESAIRVSTKDNILQTKTVNPGLSTTILTPDEGYDGFKSITINPMPSGKLKSITIDNNGLITSGIETSGYLASQDITLQLPTISTTEYIPTTADQFINSNKYLTGIQTIKGDANLVSENIRTGISIFGVNGSYTGTDTKFRSLVQGNITTVSQDDIRGLTRIKPSCFADSTLRTIDIPDGITEIGNYAFSGCGSLTTVKLPSTLTSLGDHTFGWTSSLTSLDIPVSCTNIANACFEGSALTSITLPVINNRTLNNYLVPETLKRLVLISNASRILQTAFASNFTNITYLNANDSMITTIGMDAFYNCRALSEVYLPSTITTIYSGAFNKCSRLTKIQIKSTTPPTLNSTAFTNTNNTFKIYVPANSLSDYKTSQNWSEFADRIFAIEEV